MAGRIVLGALTTLNLSTHLDPMTLDLYGVADYLKTPGYTGLTPKIYIGASDVSIGTATMSSIAGSLSTLSIGGTNPNVSGGVAFQANGVLKGYAYVDTNFAVLQGVSGVGVRLLANGATALEISTAGHISSGVDNTQTLGTSGKRWPVVYAGTGTINTSDAREKTEVAPLTANEIAAAKQLAGELGTFRFLSAVAEKGAGARMHIGMTVQRAIDIMAANGLDPLTYGFICYDRWPDTTIPARTEPRKTGLFNAQGEEMVEQIEIEPARVIKGGDRYGFRPDELLLFLARGFDARLAALEAS
jgi:hypothetical protein